MTENGTTIPPVKKKVTVRWSREEAFRRFTDEMASWWPLARHSVGGEEAETVVFEGRVGGRIFERSRDGATADWGTVKAWEPPGRVVFSWHPGRGPETAQEVEVRFESVADGTRVELVHRGWEALGPKAAETRKDYESGWEGVLGLYAG
jgi:hypothetical protein